MTPFALPEQITTWPELVKKVTELGPGWIFRGDIEERCLATALERACKSWNISLKHAPDIEQKLVREFQRHPEAGRLSLDPDDDLSWYAAMQHYGAPTRLLDWTYSPFVAAHFAFDRLLSALPSRKPTRAAIWALHTEQLTKALQEGVLKNHWRLYQKKDPKSFTTLYVDRKRPIQFIGVVNPMCLNERLSIQQGVFLCPGDIRHSWIENFKVSGSMPDILKMFVMDETILDTAFKHLSRMNVTSRSLCPGLDGYARSLLHRFKSISEIPIE